MFLADCGSISTCSFSFKPAFYPSHVSLSQKITWIWIDKLHCTLPKVCGQPERAAVYNRNMSHWASSWCLCSPCLFYTFVASARSATTKYLISCSANFWSWICSHLGKCTWIMEAAWSEAGASSLHSIVLRPDKPLHRSKGASQNWWDDVWRY